MELKEEWALVRPGMEYTGYGFVVMVDPDTGVAQFGDAHQALLFDAPLRGRIMFQRGVLHGGGNVVMSRLYAARVEETEEVSRTLTRTVRLSNGEVLTNEQSTD